MSTVRIALPSSIDRAFASLLFASCLAVLPAEARANEADDGDALIHRGLELRRQHQDAAALAEFQRAYAVSPTPRCRAQIALAEQSLGQWIAAESDLHAALAADDEWITQHHEGLAQALAFVEAHLGWIEVESSVEGAEVALDDVVVGVTPLPKATRVTAGTIVVRVSAKGYTPAARAIAVEGNAHAHAVFALAPEREMWVESPVVAPAQRALPEPSRRVAAPARPSRPLLWAGVAVTSLGVAGLAASGYFGVRVLEKKASRDEHCAGARCDAIGAAIDDDARRDAARANVALVIGAPLLVGGAVLLWRAFANGSPAAVAAQRDALLVGGTW